MTTSTSALVRERCRIQTFRRKQCDGCEFNEDGVCASFKAKYPDRACVIDVGIKVPTRLAQKALGTGGETLRAV